jgi:DNA-binding response OmpR family regulator/anti-sigma regulatory factor (Ser/Thr protein kinase)
MRDYVGRLLAEHYDVTAVGDGVAALASARAAPPDLVLSDIMMPGMDGFELLRELRADERTHTVPVVLLSARAGEESAVEGLHAGADDYLVKPFSARELLARVRTHLELARLRREWTVELERQVRERTAELLRTYQALEVEVTERKGVELKLRETQRAAMEQERLRALGQMASGIAHDINNAISPIALYTESLLEGEPGLSDRTRRYLETTQRAIADVAATIARMREFYRKQEPGSMLAPVQLNSLVEQVLELTRARWSDMPQRGGYVIKIASELTPDLPTVMGIENEIREALTNLIFNAVDAMPSGGTLSVQTRVAERVAGSTVGAEPHHVSIEVTDNGVGMDEEARRRCLEPFFTTKGDHGTGLGLARVSGMTERHGAQLTIDSTLGQGTTVRLSFVASTTPNAENPSTTPAPAPPSPMRILIVDDDPLILQSLCHALEGDGHAVVAAGSGEAAVDAFKAAQALREPFAVVITDLGMPHMDGRRVATAVKGMSPATPVILLTGWGQRLADEGEPLPHVDLVLSKPPKLRELRNALAHCCLPSSLSSS